MSLPKSSPDTVVRTAEQPGQALNVDLCFVPEHHEAQEPLPAVSGSSGRLIVAQPHTAGPGPDWPGRIFADAELAYEEAMRQYAATTRERLLHSKVAQTPELGAVAAWRIERDDQAERYRVRQQRKQEDLTWQATKAGWRHTRQAFQAGSPAQRRAQAAIYQEAQQQWQQARQQRHAIGQQRQAEN